MSRANHNQPQASGLMPLDIQTDDKAPAAGVFRLETMAPGMESPDAVAPKKARISTQMIALAVLLAIGGGLIYGMRLLGIGPLTTLAKTKMPDYDLNKPTPGSADHKRILQDLAANHAASQVPVDEVQKNPFRMADALTNAPAQANGEAGDRAAAERARRDSDARHAKMKAALAALKVNGVIGGTHPVARISGEAVRIGDTVGEFFTVKSIHGRTVEVECDGATYEISMDDADVNSNKPHKK